MRIVTPKEPIRLDEIRRLAAERFGDLVKGVRPSSGNRTRGVDDPAIREQIVDLVNRLVLR